MEDEFGSRRDLEGGEIGSRQEFGECLASFGAEVADSGVRPDLDGVRLHLLME
jgi:hypothetical protein